MQLDEIDGELSLRAFEFFYWFSRFEFALKENGYLRSDVVGADAEPGWDKFVRTKKNAYTASPSAVNIVQLAPRKQVVTQGGGIGWRSNNATSANLGNVVGFLKTVRNNLFHGGKHGDKGWDDPERTRALLESGIAVLDELADLGGFQVDYKRFY